MKRWHLVTDFTTGATTMEEIPQGVDIEQHMKQAMDDCPLCQEARTRGEVPQIVPGPFPTMRKAKRWTQPARWRKRKARP